MSSENALYLEADEDITSAIDKLTKSPATSVQIVVPKRSTMLQSIINLKLLKKAAENSKKELVLVTSDRIATDLASRVGLAVAPSLGAKPVITEAEMPEELKNHEEIIDADDPEPPASTPEPAVAKPPKKPLLRRKQVSDTPTPPSVPVPEAATEGDEPAAAAGPKSPRVKVPDFNLLQRRVMWIGGALVVVAAYTAFMYFFTSAKVTLNVSGSKIDIDTSFVADPSVKTSDTKAGVLAAQTVTVSKDLTGPFAPTGKRDDGTKATGTMSISNSGDTGTQQVLVAGTRFLAPDGKLFRSTADVTISGATIKGGKISPGTGTVQVEADQNGDSYNEAAAAYTLPALGGSSQVTAQGGQMSGGTSKTVTIVTQSDVDGAKADLLDKDKDNAARDLKSKTPSGYTAIAPSQASSVSNVQSSPAVNASGSTAQLTIHVTYTELAVKQSDYAALVETQEQSQVGKNNQIYDNGLGAAQLSSTGTDSANRQSFHLTTQAFGGQKLDQKAIAAQLSGKRFGDAADAANRLPGVAKADIALWPGWSTNLPSRTDKINITIKVANTN